MRLWALALRGLMIHLNGWGWLPENCQDDSLRDIGPHLMVPVSYSTTGSIVFPCLSTGFEMLNTESVIATVSQREELAT